MKSQKLISRFDMTSSLIVDHSLTLLSLRLDDWATTYNDLTTPGTMSLLEVGKACSRCFTIDFLPFTCPSCSLTFCRSHVHSHGCSLPTTTEHNAEAGPSSFNRKITCDYTGCSRPRIEAIAGIEHDEGERIAKQVRCNTCKGAFCTT